MKLVLTGVTGFVGKNLVPKLLEEGHEIRALVRKTSRIHRLSGYNIEFKTVDFLDKETLKGAFEGADLIIHIAGTIAGLTADDYMKGNYLVTKNLVDEYIRENLDIQFIYISSQAAAGPSRVGMPKKESDPSEPVSIYGKSKLYAENYIRAHAEQIKFTILRPPAIYGREDKAFLFYLRAIKQHYFPHIGKLQELSIVHVDDVVQAIMLLMGNEKAIGETYFLSDGEIYHIYELINMLKSAISVEKVYVLHIPTWLAMIYAFVNEKIALLRGKPSVVNRDKIRELSQEAWTVDISKIKSLGYKPTRFFKEGIKETVSWYQEKGWI